MEPHTSDKSQSIEKEFFSIENYCSENTKKLCKEKAYTQCEINRNFILQGIASTSTTSSDVTLPQF